MENNIGIGVSGSFLVGQLAFEFSYTYIEKDTILGAKWVAGGEAALNLISMAKSFKEDETKLELPDIFKEWPFTIESIGLYYYFKDKRLSLEIKVTKFGAICIETSEDEGVRKYSFLLKITDLFYLNRLPAIGPYLSDQYAIGIRQFKVEYKPEYYVGLGTEIILRILGKDYSIPLAYQYNLKHSLRLMEKTEAAAKGSSVHWFDFQKDIGFISFHRLGFALVGHKIYLYLDIGFSLSIIKLDLIELNMGIPVASDEKFSMSLNGLAVSIRKSPLLISGGLYISRDDEVEMYTGELQLRYDKYGFTALGSYGTAKNGDVTLFIFLMVSIPIGGPPYFSVTGIAGGFGFNREILLPGEIKEVRSFPFVSAALGEESVIKKGDSPGEVLKKMNQQIVYKKGEYFACAGISFTSFQVLNCYILLTLQFGARLELIILGAASASLPPKVDPVTPIGFAELVVKAVLAPEDGECSIMAALTSESFLFHRSCKLTGGFAIAFWWLGEHAGDFVVTIGGYHPDFKQGHYPAIDRVGINWKIADNLNFKGTAYFALVPSCMMAGGEFSITFEAGNLKAWLSIRADILLQWKPFHYDIYAAASIGASYRVDFLFIHHTFTIELGADMHLWGPDFQGSIHIRWYIISFTIEFNKNSREYKKTIDWEEFHKSFLPEPEKKDRLKAVLREEAGAALLNLKITGGLLKEAPKRAASIVSAQELAIEIRTALPCTKLIVNEAEKCSYTKLGIVPMGITGYSSELSIVLHQEGSTEQVPVEVHVITDKVPTALWETSAPDKNNTLKPDVPMGAVLSCKPSDPEGVLPEGGKAYLIKTLAGNEYLEIRGYQWQQPVRPKGTDYAKDDPFIKLEATITAQSRTRKQLLDNLGSSFSVRREEDIRLARWEKQARNILLAKPVLMTTGAFKGTDA